MCRSAPSRSSFGNEPGVSCPGSCLFELLEPYNYTGVAGVASLDGIDVAVVACARQAFRSKTIEASATALATRPNSKLAHAKSAPAGSGCRVTTLDTLDIIRDPPFR